MAWNCRKLFFELSEGANLYTLEVIKKKFPNWFFLTFPLVWGWTWYFWPPDLLHHVTLFVSFLMLCAGKDKLLWSITEAQNTLIISPNISQVLPCKMGKKSKRTTCYLKNLHATLSKVQKTTIEVLDPGNLPMLEVGEEGNDEEFTLAHFMDVYKKGLDGSQAVWVNRKYHGHCVLPENILAEFDRPQRKWDRNLMR